ncbi:MAG: FecR domain-containing protein [Luteolibacter sp.]
MQFEAGSIEVLYDNGVQFIVQGPADCQILYERQVSAMEGKFVARVSPDAVGFEIVTPHAKVIDRGTSFGVTIDRERQTDVVVYEGKVDLSLPEHARHSNRSLAAGEAMRIGSDGHVDRIASVASGAFLPPPRLPDSQADDGRVIVSVTDNLKSSDTTKYYRVVARGFREEAQAYVDRLHQWNGLDDRGIPPFLSRGNYVMTFNDDKTQHNLPLPSIGSTGPSLFAR